MESLNCSEFGYAPRFLRTNDAFLQQHCTAYEVIPQSLSCYQKVLKVTQSIAVVELALIATLGTEGLTSS